jgi:hypothetical protein
MPAPSRGQADARPQPDAGDRARKSRLSRQGRWWRELLFADEDQVRKAQRDPVAPARRSPAALHKAATHTLDDGTPAHSFRTLLEAFSTLVRNTCRTPAPAKGSASFELLTMPNALQRRALELIDQISV